MNLLRKIYLEFAATIVVILCIGAVTLYIFPKSVDVDDVETKRTAMLVWNVLAYSSLLGFLVLMERQYAQKKAEKTSYQDITVEFSRMEVS